jgi:hypothetical protein
MSEAKKKTDEDLEIKYLPDDKGTVVNGKIYFSLKDYFKNWEAEIKEKKQLSPITKI